MHPVVEEVTERVKKRSQRSRAAYLEKIDRAREQGPRRGQLPCGNLAHGMAACSREGKDRLMNDDAINVGIVTAYNDMLSAHQPYHDYPDFIKKVALKSGAMAQVAGGVPAMCDGVTQGQPGMDLSLFSRDVIAMSTAIALSHNMFDAAICLGICDKIVPGLMLGVLAFGHLPTVFLPAGPMPSGLPNSEKARVREAYAKGEADRSELIAVESASYHSPGTCTFYGTANSNQMLMEIMGLQLPGSSFVNPGTELREALNEAAVKQLLAITAKGNQYTPVGRILDEKALINGLTGLLATGGSTNHTIHLVAIAAAAGISLNWTDMADLSAVVPLLAQVYPNGEADVNEFNQAGGLPYVISELLSAGLLHDEVNTVLGTGLKNFARHPQLGADGVEWQAADEKSHNENIVRGFVRPFQKEGGISVLDGNLGRAVVKVSAVKPEHRKITAPAKVFLSPQAFIDAFEAGDLEDDLVLVLPFHGPRANGMPEQHRLTPYLGVMQNRGQKVALLTDGRMSGASGKVLAAIHVTPEAVSGGHIAKIRDGDLITIDAAARKLHLHADDADIETRQVPETDLAASHTGMGRELFAALRGAVSGAESGASTVV